MREQRALLWLHDLPISRAPAGCHAHRQADVRVHSGAAPQSAGLDERSEAGRALIENVRVAEYNRYVQ